MVKAEEKFKLDQGDNGTIPEVDQEVWFLGTPPFVAAKGEPVGPKVVQPR